jgi:hypothetical protein
MIGVGVYTIKDDPKQGMQTDGPQMARRYVTEIIPYVELNLIPLNKDNRFYNTFAKIIDSSDSRQF